MAKSVFDGELTQQEYMDHTEQLHIEELQQQVRAFYNECRRRNNHALAIQIVIHEYGKRMPFVVTEEFILNAIRVNQL